VRVRAALVVAFALVVALGVPVASTLARFTDAATTSGSFAVDTLAPPTGLSAVGGATVTLTWTSSVDAYTTGYAIYRSATSGSGYALVSTATPGTATTTTDSPGAGTWYYVVRATAGSWDSVDSNEATAVVTATSTTFKACVSTAADTSGAGDNNGYESNPARACISDGSNAVDAGSGNGGTASCGTGATPSVNKDRHRFWGFVLGMPGTVTSVNGIRVQATLGLNNGGGTTNLCAQLSWDGGTTWTTISSQAITTTASTVYTFGSTSNTWGRTWALSELSAANFRVRLIDASSQTTKQFRLDYLSVSVTYAP
jgi:hypothetical protein